MYTVCKVSSNSFFRSITENDFLLVKRQFSQAYTLGQVVVLRHPQLGQIVGRIEELLDDKLKIANESSAFCGSVRLSWQNIDDVVGRVVFHSKN